MDIDSTGDINRWGFLLQIFSIDRNGSDYYHDPLCRLFPSSDTRCLLDHAVRLNNLCSYLTRICNSVSRAFLEPFHYLLPAPGVILILLTPRAALENTHFGHATLVDWVEINSDGVSTKTIYSQTWLEGSTIIVLCPAIKRAFHWNFPSANFRLRTTFLLCGTPSPPVLHCFTSLLNYVHSRFIASHLATGNIYTQASGTAPVDNCNLLNA